MIGDIAAAVLVLAWVVLSLWGITGKGVLALVLCVGLVLAARAVLRRLFPGSGIIGVRFRKSGSAERPLHSR